MRLIIDGDGCPVVEQVIQLGESYELEVIIVTSYAHYSQKYDKEGVSYIFVDVDNQMADYKIASMVQMGDVLITQDYGLANICLHKARVVHHMSFEFTLDNIELYLHERHVNAVNRRKHQKYTKIPPFTQEHRAQFYQFLEGIIDLDINI